MEHSFFLNIFFKDKDLTIKILNVESAEEKKMCRKISGGYSRPWLKVHTIIIKILNVESAEGKKIVVQKVHTGRPSVRSTRDLAPTTPDTLD